MKRLFYISVLMLSVVFAVGCANRGEVNSIYSMGIYDVEVGTERDMEALERYLRSVDCSVGESFVVEGENIQENNRLAVEKFASAVSRIDYAALRDTLSDDITFTYAVVCGSGTERVTYLESVRFSPDNED